MLTITAPFCAPLVVLAEELIVGATAVGGGGGGGFELVVVPPPPHPRRMITEQIAALPIKALTGMVPPKSLNVQGVHVSAHSEPAI